MFSLISGKHLIQLIKAFFPHELLTSYLTNRFQYVKIEGECSTMKLKKRGVPPGSVLCSFLFLLFINDLGVQKDWPSEILKYADDTVMIEKPNTQSED